MTRETTMAATKVANSFSLEIDRVINAPRDRVYQAWTDPVEARVWWSGSGMGAETVEMDVRVGGRFRIAMRSDDGTAYVVGGIYSVVEPPHRLVHSWRWETGGPPTGEDSAVSIVFEDLGGTTRIAITHERFADQANADAHTAGWTTKLEGFTAYFDTTGNQGES